jgi:hypothetical protein
MAAAVVVGVTARIHAFVSAQSLWVDEAALARNILERPAVHLLSPLDYGQVCPPLFLLSVKLATLVFGHGEKALRSVAFICGIVSVPVFAVTVRRLLEPCAAVLSIAAFACAAPAIAFSVAAKPYSGDVLATLLVVLSAAPRIAIRSSAWSRCGLAAVAVCMSYTASLVVIAVVASALHDARRRNPQRRRPSLLPLCALSALSVAVIGYSQSTVTPDDRIFYQRSWVDSFMPLSAAAPGWLWALVRDTFGGREPWWLFDGSLHYVLPAFFASLAALGALSLARRAFHAFVWVTGPIGLAIAASASHSYPLGSRVSLFLLPLWLLLASEGAAAVGRMCGGERRGCVAPALCIALVVQPLLSFGIMPRPENIRPPLEHLISHFESGDSIYVHYGAGQAYLYYSSVIPLPQADLIGMCHRGVPRHYLKELDGFRGRQRLWVVLSHGSGDYGYDERLLITRYLDRIGRRRDSVPSQPVRPMDVSSRVLLYDLSDSSRLELSVATSFPSGSLPPPRLWSCYGTMSPLGPSPAVLADLRSQ